MINSGQIELTYEERVRWFVNNYYETGMEYASMLESMRDDDLDNFVWYGETIRIPKFHSGNETIYTQEQVENMLNIIYNNRLEHLMCQTYVLEDYTKIGKYNILKCIHLPELGS
jgi:hypothetical protein